MGLRPNGLRALVAMDAIAGMLIASPATAERATLQYRVVSTDPYTNTNAFHGTEVEPAVCRCSYSVPPLDTEAIESVIETWFVICASVYDLVVEPLV